jgi:putative drug exporter of the RND superfamily
VTERLARWSSEHAWRVVLIWVVAVVASVGVTAALLGDVLTTEGELTNDPESLRGEAILEERLPPSDDFVNEIVVVRSDTLTFGDSAFREKVEQVDAAIEATGAAPVVRTPYETGDRELVSRDRDATIIAVGMGPDAENTIPQVMDAVEAADGGGFDVSITGEFSADDDLNRLSEDDLREGELQFGLPAALVVLLIVFGTVIAGLLPLLLAVVSIIVALALAALIGQAFDLSLFIVNMLTGMGLALGIDYSLFIVSRYREERSGGRQEPAAIVATGATASRAVLFSGMTFVLAMLGMVLVPDTILRSLALGAILVGAVSVVAALTLLPALLGLLGDRVNALRIPYLGRNAESGTAREGRLASAVARGVMRRPVVALVASVALLLAAAVPVLDLNIGFAGIRTFPDHLASKQGFDAFQEEFGVGTPDSVQVVVDGDVGSPPAAAAVDRLAAEMGREPALRQPTVDEFPERRLAVVEALVAGDSRDQAAIDAVERLRDETVPGAFAGVDADVLVTGETAEIVDYFAMVEYWLPIVFGFVLGLSFVLLTIAFRSLLVPLKAILLNLISVGAAYGLIVLVFQKGVGNELFGFQQVDTVEAWLPLFLFSVLFGLSMDYHVFLLSRIRERYNRTGDNDDAVLHAVATTARLITGAALIIVAVFSGFARGDLVMFQQMGFGVAVALLLDATVVRTVLVPASMKLLSDWNWYLPSWLHWLPDFHVEGARAS